MDTVLDLDYLERLVRSRYGEQWREHLGSGWVGMNEAASRFDPDHGVKFMTFARHFIYGRIIDAARVETGYRRAEMPEALSEIALERSSYEHDFSCMWDVVPNHRSLRDDEWLMLVLVFEQGRSREEARGMMGLSAWCWRKLYDRVFEKLRKGMVDA